jgi:lipopolysaccharide transport system permease protein
MAHSFSARLKQRLSQRISQTLGENPQGLKLDLLRVLVQRELAARYQGSIFGNFWAVAHQVTQLALYTYVFAIVLKVKLSQAALPQVAMMDDRLLFALWLFGGLIPWNAVTMSFGGSAMSVVNQPNLVKKVVFPLILLPLVPIATAFFDSTIGMMILITVVAIALHTVHLTLFLLPLVWIPQVMLTAGIGYLLAGLTVFLRDIPQTVTIAVNFLFYLTPIMYPIEAVPAMFQPIMRWNPAGIMADLYRDLILWGELRHLQEWGVLWLVSAIVFVLGISVYKRLRPAFADVL